MTDQQTFLRAIRAKPSDSLPKLIYADWLEENGLDGQAKHWREEATKPLERWHYNGDVNLKYGGVFIDLSTWDDGYCDAIHVTDLDSACGFDGAVLIEHVTINGVDNPDRIRWALRSCGTTECRGWSKASIRHMIAEALMSYGHCDVDRSETIQTEADGPMVFDGWRASKRLHNTTLEAYVRSVHLGE